MRASHVQVVDYDARWPAIFRELADRIWPAIRDVALAIEHVGSTSIPGMAAKPVIDLDIVIASRAGLSPVIARLEPLGYRHRGNLGVEDRDAFFSPENVPRHHLYVCVQNSIALQNHIAVRDYLRAHPSDAAAYSALKKRLAARFPQDMPHYIEGKTPFLISILERCGLPPAALQEITRVNKA
jgi:GrpB-like predicted nucleotidyltransferase (UPF0157 family)